MSILQDGASAQARLPDRLSEFGQAACDFAGRLVTKANLSSIAGFLKIE